MRRDAPRPELGREDRAWVEEVASAFSPAPMNADRARAFRLAIDARAERRGRGLRTLRAGGAFALAATVGLALGIGLGRPAVDRDRPVVVAEAPAPPAKEPVRSAWIETDEDGDAALPEESLPGEYLALASFVDGE